MSDPTLTVIDSETEIAWVWTTLKNQLLYFQPKFQVAEEMIALLALIGFYIFGICCYEIFNGLLEPTNEKLIASKKCINNRITYDTLI